MVPGIKHSEAQVGFFCGDLGANVDLAHDQCRRPRAYFVEFLGINVVTEDAGFSFAGQEHATESIVRPHLAQINNHVLDPALIDFGGISQMGKIAGRLGKQFQEALLQGHAGK